MMTRKQKTARRRSLYLRFGCFRRSRTSTWSSGDRPYRKHGSKELILMALPAVRQVLKCVPLGRFPFVAEVPMGRLAACVCGRLRVSCNREPVKISLCHCLECQRRTGRPYGIAAFFRRVDVEPNGQDQRFTRQSDSGYPVTFHFCPGCGSSVYWEPSRIPEMIAVAVGAFADPAFPPPSQSVYGEHRHPWVNSPTETQSHPSARNPDR
jgi:hypothetical protein